MALASPWTTGEVCIANIVLCLFFFVTSPGRDSYDSGGNSGHRSGIFDLGVGVRV
jgi:hypothetical protein